MKKKILVILLVLIHVFTFSSCYSSKNNAPIKDNSKVLVTVTGNNITEKNIDMMKISSNFSEKEILEKLIDDELLLIKAKELNISVSDKEAKAEVEKQKELMEKIDDKDEGKIAIYNLIKQLNMTEEQYWNCYAVQGYKRALTISKTKAKLGVDTRKILDQLKKKVNIKYYN